jgi:hypothetical protein
MSTPSNKDLKPKKAMRSKKPISRIGEIEEGPSITIEVVIIITETIRIITLIVSIITNPNIDFQQEINKV